MPRGIVVTDDFDWGDDTAPATPWGETVVYEMHVKGYTARHPYVPAELRGTYAGLAHPAALEHLLSLGVTAVELLPVHQSAPEPPLADRGVSNYWGYSTLGFFAPHAAYAADRTPGGQVAEFKQMVKTLHAAGLEVILDVVYNHTAEGGPDGPSLMFRGLGERDHYKLAPHSGSYVDTTGCGNTLDVGDLDVLRLVLDSLRYWVTEMHVDGFRFDLATALTRERMDVDERSPFLAAVHQDPVLRQVKLIAEPWDVGPGGYRLGMFGSPWAEWNDAYRDDVRSFWRGGPNYREAPADMGWRLTGSQDVFHGRSPAASVNFLTAHDGFTLRDLVSYDGKHNEANGEENRDGTDNNRSWNHGVEGPTDDPAIEEQRRAPCARCSPRCCSRPARRCSSWATSSAAPRTATTTPTTRTTRCPGSTGISSPGRPTSSAGRPPCSTCAATTRRCGRPSSSTAAPSPTAAPPTSPGCARTARR